MGVLYHQVVAKVNHTHLESGHVGSSSRTLGKSLNLSEHLFPYSKEEIDTNGACLLGLWRGLHKLIVPWPEKLPVNISLIIIMLFGSPAP